MQSFSMRSFCAAVVCCVLYTQAGIANTDATATIRSQLFSQVETARAAAIAVNAEIYAPKTFAQGNKHLSAAEKSLAKGRSIERITNSVDKASEQLELAQVRATAAQSRFSNTIQARQDAAAVESARFASATWLGAEKHFNNAVEKHEAGKIESASKRALQAEQDYRAAELEAIKKHYLTETRRLIADAKKQKVSRYAPQTLAAAARLLKDAETELNQNRYDTDQARSLARRAKVEAGHAFYLMNELKPVRDGKLSEEAFALKTEQPLLAIAGALDMNIDLDAGPVGPTSAMVEAILTLRADSAELSLVRQETIAMEAEMRRLNDKLGLQSTRLMRQAEIKRKITLLESMFSFKEARVYRQGGNLLLRMVGLNFQSGKAVIQSQQFALLTQLIKALEQFPGASITLEGHTDSFGSDAVNLQLSQDRADAVKAYLNANVREDFFKAIDAVGFGETRPVANNETAAGRKINRRIDLLIRPQF